MVLNYYKVEVGDLIFRLKNYKCQKPEKICWNYFDRVLFNIRN